MENNKKDLNTAEFAASRSTIGGRSFGRGRQIVEKPKSFKRTLRRLWSYFATEKRMFYFTFFLVIISSLLLLIVPYIIGLAIDAIHFNMTSKEMLFVVNLLIIIVGVYVINAFNTFLQSYLIAGISQRIVFTLRKILFGKLKKLPISFFDTRTHGEIMSRISNDIDNISLTISSSTTQLMALVITIFGSFVMMLILSPLLTIGALVSIPLVFLLTNFVTKKTRVLFREQQKVLGQLNGHIEENITGMMIVRTFNEENSAVASFKQKNDALCKIGMKANILSGLLMPLMNVINNFSFTIVATLGGTLAVYNWITIGVIASFLTYSKQFTRPLNEIANIYNTLQTSIAGAERVFEILDLEEEAKDQVEAVVLENPKGEVEFSHVSFSYREDVKILHDISFKVEKGSRIALVGPTGAGKTTIVNLLARFYDVTEGCIKIDDVDIRNYTRNSLRNSFSIVLQDTYLFSGTIRDNIRYGRFDATDEEIKQAAIEAEAHHFIERLPNGYETVLTESGSSLSLGERQLLAIARAILVNAPILILDEATSSVDTRTELHIQEALARLMKGRTSFIIAHRLSTIKDCDTIMVINHGKIIECGSHGGLIANKGFYFDMYTSQINKT